MIWTGRATNSPRQFALIRGLRGATTTSASHSTSKKTTKTLHASSARRWISILNFAQPAPPWITWRTDDQIAARLPCAPTVAVLAAVPAQPQEVPGSRLHLLQLLGRIHALNDTEARAGSR